MKTSKQAYLYSSIALGSIGLIICFFASLPYGYHSHADAHGLLGISISIISLILMIVNETDKALSNLFFGAVFGSWASLIDQNQLWFGIVGLAMLGIAYYFLLKANYETATRP
ncbi:LPXTG cell wall anchor domain-containing protein [Polynucleobacter asymbioticus]|jgi:LPXTG-motif cell wall-anchored protein|uniref:Uncharacterized protein n=1 Tax=Polynucleobacter asymbioticus TaxID=576611 RepID=A0AAC9IVA1_9BURK|nr:LPXTG cell wall anchor domain-containing protein [Polynucleobacter asymbioticus]APB99049.1 hypothetical protein A4F89_06755 [Polynucleobacter asymbioticus]APC01350.1 hypothetical protein AOC25_06850 [Polynucleobacter asymbioticus]